ncbi:MAG: PIN domain-containing protein, partial [Chitinophaga rupis]
MSRSLVTTTALLDANVLYPAPLRDYLLHLASLGVYEPIWTDSIQDEWIRSLIKVRPDISRAALVATQRAIDKAFPGSNVAGHESLIDNLSLPDPDDRHVLAAAIKGGAQIIVTANLKDFPTK